MKIAYLVHLNMGPKSGVYKKIIRQAKTWTDLGHSVKLFIFTKAIEVENDIKAKSPCEAIITRYASSTIYRLFQNIIRAIKKLENEINKWKPDIIYTREDWPYPPIIRLAKQYPLIVEVNGNSIVQIWKYSKVKGTLWFVTRNFLLKEVKGLCFISNELAEMKSFKKYNKPYLVLGNGIEIKPFFPSNTLKNSVKGNKGARLVFIGNPGCPWHGIDKILKLANLNSDWVFDIIGYGPKDVIGDIPKNVILHGMMKENEYKNILDMADCAIDSLALHRKLMNEDSTLKTREYLVHGLPVIMAHKDTDFPSGADFILQIPNTENNIVQNNEIIRKFVDKWKGRNVPLEKIMHLDIKAKETRRLKFIQSIISYKNFKKKQN